MLVNALYHTAVASGLAMGYYRLRTTVFVGAASKLDFPSCLMCSVVIDVAVPMSNKATLIRYHD